MRGLQIAKFEWRGLIAMAALALATLSSTGPLAAQTEVKPDSEPVRLVKVCPDGQRYGVEQACPDTSPKNCPPGSAQVKVAWNENCRKAEQPKKLRPTCPNGQQVDEMSQCPKTTSTYTPRPISNRTPPNRQCTGKILVPYWASCPDLKSPPVQFPAAKRPVQPKEGTNQWVPYWAYPKDALAAGTEGTVGFYLHIDGTGKPTQCGVEISSGNDSLDWAACENVMQRARFYPALDFNGDVIPSIYRNRVRWMTPGGGTTEDMTGLSQIFYDFVDDDAPMLFDVAVEMVVNAEGSLQSCVTDNKAFMRGEDMKLPDDFVVDICKDVPAPLLDETGKPKKSRFTFTVKLESAIIPD